MQASIKSSLARERSCECLDCDARTTFHMLIQTWCLDGLLLRPWYWHCEPKCFNITRNQTPDPFLDLPGNPFQASKRILGGRERAKPPPPPRAINPLPPRRSPFLSIQLVISTLRCIFLSKRLCETRAGGQRQAGDGIHATWREICIAEYRSAVRIPREIIFISNARHFPSTTFLIHCGT